jgi:uncharacterized coiled-coil protein SlyX
MYLRTGVITPYTDLFEMSNNEMNGQQQYPNNNNMNSSKNNNNMNSSNNNSGGGANASGNGAPTNSMANFNNNNASNTNNSNANTNPNNANANTANANNANNSTNSGGESKSILQQVASQEKRIVELNKTLNDRNQTLAKFQTEKKTEMEALMAGMKQWIGNLDVKNEGHKDEFEKGLQRLVDTSSFDNGVWQVMVSASACAAKKEEDYQALKIQFEELNQQKSGGVFNNADERVGVKRQANGEPDQDSGSAGDIWSNFIADVSTTGYPMY